MIRINRQPLLHPLLCGMLCTCMLIVTPGCSFLAPTTQTVTIRADDPAAELFVNNRPVGTGEATLKLERDRAYRLMARSPDGRTASAHLSRQISAVGWVDIVGGIVWMVPFLGGLAPGFWDLNPRNATLRLPPAADRPQAPPAGGPKEIYIPEPWRGH